VGGVSDTPNLKLNFSGTDVEWPGVAPGEPVSVTITNGNGAGGLTRCGPAAST
jgi:hypothetical protein